MKFDVQQQTTLYQNKALNYRNQSKKKEFKVTIEVNDKICNKFECEVYSQNVGEKSEIIRNEMQNSVNQSQSI